MTKSFTNMNEEHQGQTIRSWGVTGNDRIVGAVYNRPGHADGGRILTSSVIQIRRMGANRTPVAFTESGTAYWLGEPSSSFGLQKAQAFILLKSRVDAAPVATDHDPAMQTSIIPRAHLNMELELALEERS